jgi:SAM-dependent methyltransferase
MSANSGAAYYDQYWTERDRVRTAARSKRRADLALAMLGSRRGSLLELGCGPGWALECFAQAGFESVGIDVSKRAVEDARQRGLTAHAVDVDAVDLPESLGHFDVVIALEVLEHLVDPLSAVEKILAVLRPGGCLVVSLPNEWTLPRRLTALVGRPGFGGHDDPHLRHFGVRSGRRFLESAGLRVVSSRFDGILPPRWKMIKSLSEPLASCFPGLFAISGVYLLEPDSTS